MKTTVFIFIVFFIAACDPRRPTLDPGKTGYISKKKGREPEVRYYYAQPGDSSGNYYAMVLPEEQLRGVLILFSGFSEMPEETLRGTDIHKFASRAGYMTLVPAFDSRFFLYFDTASQQKVNRFIDSMFRQYDLPEAGFFLGGYSLGGLAAVQYTERAYGADTTLRRPAGVFGADPPLDIERIYNSMTSTDRPPKDPRIAAGEKMFIDLVQEELGTNPRSNPQAFRTLSPFAFSDTSHAAIRPLVNVPLRLYHDPDINWYIQNRQVDYSDLNVVDGAAVVNWLRYMGNRKAELMIRTGKGFRDGIRWPHSWSIIDGKELVEWMDRINPAKQ